MPSQRKLVGGAFAASLVLSALAGLGVAGFAAAHTCSQTTTDINDHGGCNAHSCPGAGLPHSHTTNHLQGALAHKCSGTPNPLTMDAECAFLNAGGDVVIADNGVGGCIQDDMFGSDVSVSIFDQFASPASGFVCWESCSVGIPFCGSHGSPLLGSRLLVFVDGPVFGNPVLSPCGGVSMATAGTIYISAS